MLRSFGDIHVPEVAAHDPDELSKSRKRAALILTLAFWLSNYVLLSLATILSGNPHAADIALVRIGTTLIGLACCYLIHLLLRNRRLTTTRSRLIALALV